jgi:lipoprotein-releasing system ATP-binding protein
MLIARDIKKIYRAGAKGVSALNSVSLEIGRGETVAIVGPSGAGKSTILHILGALDRPTSGEVTLDGTSLYRLTDDRRARIRNAKIGFVFQSYNLMPEFTALENVMLPGMIRRPSPVVRRSSVKNNAEKLLREVGLGSRMNHRPGELSGGEQQRVAIARALANGPEILLCDEPTGNLDSKTSESIYGLLFGLKSNSGTTLVIVTHDESISSRVSRTIRLKDGKLA